MKVDLTTERGERTVFEIAQMISSRVGHIGFSLWSIQHIRERDKAGQREVESK